MNQYSKRHNSGRCWGLFESTQNSKKGWHFLVWKLETNLIDEMIDEKVTSFSDRIVVRDIKSVFDDLAAKAEQKTAISFCHSPDW